MNKPLAFIFFFSVFGLLSLSTGQAESSQLKELAEINVSLDEVRVMLGGEKLSHAIDVLDPVKVKLGKELVHKGRTKKGLIKSKLISPYFVCTDCHNVGREFDQTNSQNPDQRLSFAQKNNLPFLPGSTFWGVYNRTKFYNGDYVKKYGDIIKDAKGSLTESIQVCAQYCSAGRELKDWEEEAILHYLKTLELTINDIELSQSDRALLIKASAMSQEEKKTLLQKIENTYVHEFVAHFDEALPVDKRKYGQDGNKEKGEFIYNNACLFCHKDGRVTFLKLDKDKLSGNMFVKNMRNYSDKSIYQIVRYGTYTKAGRNQYMPLYTKDKMTDEQINDLIAYIQQIAGK